MGDLTTYTFIFFIFCIVAVCVFEFVNGFHDTANAVATVIYTGTLKPQHAVIWSGLWNFLGVITGGVGVAMGIVKLLPMGDMMSNGINENICLIFGILVAAIFWNLFTWYFGIPCSSSHTLFGSIIGVGIVFQFLHGGDGPNWTKTGEILMSLLLSPALGFVLAIALMYLLKLIASRNVALFSEPDKESKPPLWIRAILIATCTGVSYAHGSNDGQKGVGLMMILLMMFLPMHYALNTNTISHTSAIGQYMKTGEAFDMNTCKASVDKVEALMVSLNNKPLLDDVNKLKEKLADLEKDPSGKKKFSVRKAIQKLNKNIDDAVKKSDSGFTKAHQSQIKAELGLLQGYTDWAPVWVILLISLSLGIGTMIGWKRIVVTIGEKIGKTHLTYAQGMVAEAMAASMIYFSTTYKLPVSTTHILSSSVAGTMVATEGTKNLQAGTIKNIGAAWVLTLPVTIIVSGFVYYVLQMIFA